MTQTLSIAFLTFFLPLKKVKKTPQLKVELLKACTKIKINLSVLLLMIKMSQSAQDSYCKNTACYHKNAGVLCC